MSALRGWLRLIVQMSLAASEQEKQATGGQTLMVSMSFIFWGE